MATDYYVKSGSGVLEMQNRTWATGSPGDRMIPAAADVSSNVNIARRWVWECTTGGTSNGTPTWPSSVTQDTTTVTQNGVVWTARRPGYSSGSTASWAFATLYLWYLLQSDGTNYFASAGDRIFVSNNHNETNSTIPHVNYYFDKSTITSPIMVLCVDDSAAPPTALATTAVVSTAVFDDDITVANAGFAYFYGITFKNGTGSFAEGIFLGGAAPGGASTPQHYVFENCNFELLTTSTNNNLFIGVSYENVLKVVFKNTSVKFSAAGQAIRVIGELLWHGGLGLTSGTTSPTYLFYSAPNNGNTYATRACKITCEGIDFSNGGASMNFMKGGATALVDMLLRNCKLPSSWSGVLWDSAPSGPAKAKLHNCDSSDTNYRIWEEDALGSVKTETTLVRTGGASDGTTTISWKVATSASAGAFVLPLLSIEGVRWNETTGSAITVTIDILHDSATNLKDSEIWLEVQYLGTSGVPLGSFINDAKTNVLATAADQASSSATWTTTGMSNPNKQKLSVTFTPQEKGVIHGVVHVAKASYTVYVDPILQVS